MPLKTSFFTSLTDEPICQPYRVSIKTLHVKLFFDKKTCVCQKLSWGGGAGVVGKYPTPEPCKIGGCPMSGTHKAGKCPTVEPGGMGIAGIDGA